jgi:hypothetical protein
MYGAAVSLDAYIAGPDGEVDWLQGTIGASPFGQHHQPAANAAVKQLELLERWRLILQ